MKTTSLSRHSYPDITPMPPNTHRVSPDISEPCTEEKIFNAACSVFFQKGFDGTRMRDIAAEARINISMLHYYYRSKEHLFSLVLSKAFENIYQHILEIVRKDTSVMEKIRGFIEVYVDFFMQYPHLPRFLLNEVALRKELPSLNTHHMQVISEVFQTIDRQLQIAGQKKLIRPVSSHHLVLNIISLSIFPFLAQPVTTKILKFTPQEYQTLLADRKEEIISFVTHALRP